MLLLLHAIIHLSGHMNCNCTFWHYHPYILYHFSEMFFTLVSTEELPPGIKYLVEQVTKAEEVMYH